MLMRSFSLLFFFLLNRLLRESSFNLSSRLLNRVLAELMRGIWANDMEGLVYY